MLTVTQAGLHCAAGRFHLDPVRAVDRALITHAHSDHARPGCRAYLCARESVPLLRRRLGRKASITGLAYGAPLTLDGVRVSFHPAGHILGSAQIRVEHRGEVWVLSGDYKPEPDPTCTPFEPVRCHTFITECTFGLPIYRWPATAEVFADIDRWWQANQREGTTSVLLGYSLGKAQRLLAGLNPDTGPIFVHDSVREFLPAYEEARIRLPEALPAQPEAIRAERGLGLVVAPPAVQSTPWFAQLGDTATGFASGWMLVRSGQPRNSRDRGFVLSDHADWPGLIASIRATGATRVLATHGATAPLVRWLRENGWDAAPLGEPGGAPANPRPAD